jgi:histidyl-tRNA synthetase
MTERQKFRAVKGVRDILPPESALWNRVEQTARETFATYNFGEIRLPIFEQTELFARSIGAETEVVSKEMYSFEDHGPAELEQRRADLIANPPKIHERPRFTLYEQNVSKFVADLSQGMAKGEIPRTSENERKLHKILEFIEHSKSLFMQSLQEQLGVHAATFDGYLQGIAAALNSFHFGDAITLRPEATASVCRAYIEHGMHTLPGNVKLYYIGPMFRRERPQKGRFRQFYQIGAEVLGQSDAPAIDAEVVEMLMEFFERCGLGSTTLYINSIGCQECRPAYVAKLRQELTKVKDRLGPDSQRRIETNPLRVLDSKLPEEQAIIEKLPRIADSLCDACKTHFAQVQAELKQRGIAYEVNWRLVRGLDYYMRTTFEITAPGLGAQNAICGGGRYDGLVELLGGPPTKGIGFAIGTDRVVLALQEAGKGEARSHVDVFVAWMGASAYPVALRLARRLRAEKLSVEVPAEDMKFKKSIGLADKLGARYALIIGEDEVASGSFTLKRLADGEQKKLSESELLEYLKAARTA